MTSLKPTEKLDHVLSCLISIKGLNIHYSDFLNMFPNYEKKEFNEIVMKLEKDGFLIKVEQTFGINEYSKQTIDVFYSTFDGRLFIENGGYTKEKEIRESLAIISSQNEIRIIRNELWVLRGTWAATIVGLLVLSWYIFVWLCPHPNDCFCK